MGQTSSRPKPAAPASAGPGVEDIIKLAKAGLSEDIIIEQIRKRGQPYDLSTDQILALKAANVSDRIVAFMLDPSNREPAAAPAPSPVAAAAPPATPSLAPPLALAPAVPTSSPSRQSPLPHEVGVYAKKNGDWIPVPSEMVNWKTAGALKTIATVGVIRENVNGLVAGVRSKTALNGPVQLMIVPPEGVELSEYQLVHLRVEKDCREFRTVTGGVLHSHSDASRDRLPLEGKKLAGRQYSVDFPEGAGPGEYGLLPPASTNGTGKIYSFRVVE
jgi:hypothetical protein